MAEVIWLDAALRDIEELAEFIARDSVVYADRMVANIFESAEILILFPKAGRKIPEKNDPKYREIQVPPFRLLYKLDGVRPIVLAVIHSKRDASKLIKKLR